MSEKNERFLKHGTDIEFRRIDDVEKREEVDHGPRPTDAEIGKMRAERNRANSELISRLQAIAENSGEEVSEAVQRIDGMKESRRIGYKDQVSVYLKDGSRIDGFHTDVETSGHHDFGVNSYNPEEDFYLFMAEVGDIRIPVTAIERIEKVEV